MSNHTPTPWLLSGRTVYALNEEGVNRFSALVHGAHAPAYELDANARRIVACVNACEGIPTELVEAGGFAAVPVATHREVKAQRDALLAERDRLREALEQIEVMGIKSNPTATDFGIAWDRGLLIGHMKDVARAALKGWQP